MENNISIAVLAEYSANMKELIDILISNGIVMKQYYSGCDRIKLLGSLNSVEPKLDTDHASIQIINGKDILCCVHLNCQLYSGHQGRREILIEQIVHDIQTVEQEINTENSIVVGDFNISPYDPSCIDARYFHGIPVYSEAKRKSRDVERKEYYMFYNPMWNLLGDFKPPYGTYYSNEGGTQNTFWYIFDLRRNTAMEANLNLSKKLDFADIDLTAPERVIEEILSELPKETNGIILGKVEAYNGPVFSHTTFGLSELTKGDVIGALGGTKFDVQQDLGEIGQEIYKYECFLYTPEYDKYKYRVFFVNYGITNYPVDIILEESVAESISSSGAYIYTCGTRDELESLIFKIFSSKRVISVMQNLIWINQAKRSARNVL